ncbi:MAG: hypothetical protein V3U89_08630 [Methylophilaceae bacterium]
MLRKAGSTPQVRLLSLFDILDDWAEAPGIAEQFKASELDETPLKTYLGLEAAKAGAALPEILATQLYVMAQSGIQEKLLGNNPLGLAHAKSAAEALISAQTKKEFHIARSSVYAIAASFFGVMIIVGSIFMLNKPTSSGSHQLAITNKAEQFKPMARNVIASPQSTAALVAQIEKMRSGNCRLLEALQLPDEYKSVYFQNIVLGQISTNPSEQKLVRQLLEKIRCNYSPMLMKKST